MLGSYDPQLDWIATQPSNFQTYLSSFPFSFLEFSVAYILLFLLVLQRENKKLFEDLEAMKETLRLEHNRAEQVKERVEEELTLARLIRRGADRDLF